MRNKQIVFYSIVCSLNILFLFAVILDVLLPLSRIMQSVLILLSNTIYIVVYNRRTTTKATPFYYCYIVFCLLLIIQIAISLINYEIFSTFYLAASILLIIISFWRVLIITYAEFNSIDKVVLPYCWINLYTIYASIIVFILLLIGAINVNQFLIDPTKYELFNGNYEVGGSPVSNPLHSVYMILADRGVKFFGQFGFFCGICHEPHASALLLMPSLFLMLPKYRNKLLLLILFIINVLLTASVTNMIVFSLCIVTFVFFCNNLSNKSIIYIKIFFAITLLYSILNFQAIVDKVGFEIIQNKLQADNMSYETSNNILNYLYNPKSILGSGILIYSYNAKATDIGFISFLLNLFFDILFVLGIVKLFLSRNKSAMIMSIGLIYFFLHVQKIGQMMYQFPYLMSIVFLGHLMYIKYVYSKEN